MRSLRVGIVGCGAVAERNHLPAIEKSNKLVAKALVDPNRQRTEYLSEKFNVNLQLTKLDNLEEYVDLAILAVPHHLHAPLAIELLKKGLHVFVEKPLAVSLTDANAIITTARKLKKKVGVGLVRRFYPSVIFVKNILEKGLLGELESFDIREGIIYKWPAASNTLFRKQSGGGVLYDTGAHTLDMLLWWLGGFKEVEFYDDNYNGVEANCELHLTLKTGVKGIVEFSRTRNLRNTVKIKGKKAEIEVGFSSDSPIVLRTNGMQLEGTADYLIHEKKSFKMIFCQQLEDFCDSILENRKPSVNPESSLESIRLFEQCRKKRKQIALCWKEFDDTDALEPMNDKKILVLGGTGFIGGRLVEVLATNTTAKIRVLARNFSRLSEISRFDVDIHHGDITDRDALSKALIGCDLVFNCTYGKGDANDKINVNIVAVKLLLEEAARQKVMRVIHVSTVAVYGLITEGIIKENLRAKPQKSQTGALTKYKGERLALEYSKKLGVSISVIQPTVVYGPNAPSWTTSRLHQLQKDRMILVDEGEGICNAIYIDDLIQALTLAATNERAHGEIFLISGEEQINWKDFYGAYEEMLGYTSTVSMSLNEVKKYFRFNRKESVRKFIFSLMKENIKVLRKNINLPLVNEVYRFCKIFLPKKSLNKLRQLANAGYNEQSDGKLLTQKPIAQLDDSVITFYSLKSRVDIHKAKTVLGYKPRFSFKLGMERTEKWAKWANFS